MMKDYRISQVTEAAKALQKRFVQAAAEIAEQHAGTDVEERQQTCRAEAKKPQGAQASGDFSFRDEVDANLLSVRPEGSATEVLKVSDLGFLILGDQQIDIRMLHDIATLPQLNAVAFLARKLINQVNPLERFQRLTMDMPEKGSAEPKWICREKEVERLLEEVQEEGLESAYSAFFTECQRWMDLPRKYEILAVLSRMRIG